jgi:GTP-binding protein
MNELNAYNPEIAKRPHVIAANKIDVMTEEEREIAIQLLKDEFEPEGMEVFPISAVSGEGVQELLWRVNSLLKELPPEATEFETEYFIENQEEMEEPILVYYNEKDKVFDVEGPRIQRMLGYTNMESEKGFNFFQKFLKENGILKELERLGIQEGDTVRLYELEFDYYK